MWRPSRRRLLAAGGAMAAAGASGVARAQSPLELRVGAVFPTRTGENSTVKTSVNDLIGLSARMGALLAERQIADLAELLGVRLHVLLANAPTPEAAVRAGDRLVAADSVHALVGGVGEGQAEVLAAIADEAEIPFFNIGAPSDLLRRTCSPYSFHVAASAAMYLDTMVAWSASRGRQRFFIVHQDNEEGRALQQRAAVAVERHGGGGAVAGSAGTQRDQLIYGREMTAIRDAGADVILVLLDSDDQVVFLGQQESYRLDVPAVTFPTTLSQTRDYISASRGRTGAHSPNYRFALWETTLNSDDAGAFNELFMARWGEAVEPTGWAAYQAIKIMAESVARVRSASGPAIARYLERPDATFNVAKGAGTSFRPWDHQLRQPLYVVRVNHDAEWTRLSLTSRVEIADIAAELPNTGAAGGDPVAALDRFGDGPADFACRL